MTSGDNIAAQIESVNKAGWAFLNLFQLDGERWRCNLYKWERVNGGQDYYCEFADATTPQWAIALALEKAKADPKPYSHATRPGKGPRYMPFDGVPGIVVERFLAAMHALIAVRQ